MTWRNYHKQQRRQFSIASIAAIATIASIASIVTGCDRRPLEVYYIDRAQVMLRVDWMTEFGMRPSGMTVVIYDENGNYKNSFSRNEVDLVSLSLGVGKYTAVVFNGDPDQFTAFNFVGAETLETFRLEATPNNTRNAITGGGGTPVPVTDGESSTRLWDAGTRYSWEPDETIGRGIVSFEITQEMLDRQLKFLYYTERDKAYTHTDQYYFDVVVQPLQTMIHIRVHVNGMENMYRMETSLSGVADGCSMLTRWRNTTECTIFYDSQKWAYTYDNPGSSNGWVTVTIPTWGEPHGKELAEQREETDNMLRMNFTLRDRAHTQKYFEFEVGKLIEYHDEQADPEQLTPPDVLRHLYLTINREIPLLPDVDPDEPTGGGFNAYVDDWDFGGDWDLGTF